MRRLLVVLGLSLAIALFISAIAVWAVRRLAVDDCLDRGGAWNPSARTCAVR